MKNDTSTPDNTTKTSSSNHNTTLITTIIIAILIILLVIGYKYRATLVSWWPFSTSKTTPYKNKYLFV